MFKREVHMREITHVQAINEALRGEMRLDERVFIMGEDVEISHFGSEARLVDEFGKERVRNTPISESAFAGAAVGAAACGLRPVVEMGFSGFLYVAMDQLVNNAAKLRYMSGGQTTLPIVYLTTTGARGSIAAQHSESPYSMFANVPGLKIVLPSTPYDAMGLLRTAIRDDNPVMFFVHVSLGPVKQAVPEEEYLIPFGEADVKREGTDLSIIAISGMVRKALAAAERLGDDGISAEVIDPRTLVPLDKETIIRSVRKTGRLVIVDEAPRICGAAGEIAAIVADEGFEYLKAPIKRVTRLQTPVPFSPPLEQYVLPNEEKIVAAAKDVLEAHYASVHR